MENEPNGLQRRVMEWLEEKWTGSFSCEVCEKSLWSVGSNFITPSTLKTDYPKFAGVDHESISPQVMILCKHCGNTKYFSVGVMGIVSIDKE